MTDVLVKVGFLALAALNGAIIFTIMDVKGASWMQRRPGPLHVGLRGFIFPVAEILKFVQKEDIIPTEVDRPVFKWAPAYVMVSCVALFAVVPMSPTLVVADLELGVFFGQIVGFLIFMVAATAEMMRVPFDMPIGESELTMGFMTEYSGIRFLIFYISEYMNMFILCAIASTLFLGGYHVPLLPTEWVNFYGPVVLLTKTAILGFILVAIRWSQPRFREDQLQNLAWKILIPASLVNILVTAIMKVGF